MGHAIDEKTLRRELRRSKGRIKVAARSLRIPSSTMTGMVAKHGLREYAAGLRTGTGLGRPRDDDLTPERAWAAWLSSRSINGSARTLKCHPDKFLARVREARAEEIEREHEGDVRAFLRADREARARAG